MNDCAPLRLDTVRLRGPVAGGLRAGDQLEATLFDRHPGGELRLRSGAHALPRGARLYLDTLAGNPAVAVEFSAPHVAAGSNVSGATLAESLEVGSDVVRAAAAVVDWVPRFEELHVQRLDLVRDFEDVGHIDGLLTALSRVYVPRCPPTMLMSMPGSNGALTLSRGSRKRWTATLYSKHAESLSRMRTATNDLARRRALNDALLSEGRLRYEARLRARTLREAGQVTVRDLCDATLRELRWYYFHHAGFDREVGGMRQIAEIIADSDLTTQSKHGLAGWLLFQAAGVSTGAHRNTDSRLRGLAKDLGVAPMDLVGLARATQRLDFGSGQLVETANRAA